MTPRQILHAFGGKLHGNRTMKQYVCRTMVKLPEEIALHITRDCWFLGSTEDAWAYSFRGDEIAGKHLIVLSDELFAQSDEQIEYTIVHEIGHIILGHRNAILSDQSRSETARQEREAHEFALRYIRFVAS